MIPGDTLPNEILCQNENHGKTITLDYIFQAYFNQGILLLIHGVL
jgi:hypothetical protein